MESIPLVLKFKFPIMGPGFVAGVRGCGRVRMVQEGENEWWLYGVNPGAIAECGSTPKEAHLNFMEAFKNLLIDYAKEAGSFDNFEKTVNAFVTDTDIEEEADWVKARAVIRSGVAVSEPFANMEKVTDEHITTVSVGRLDLAPHMFSPADNADSTHLIAA